MVCDTSLRVVAPDQYEKLPSQESASISGETLCLAPDVVEDVAESCHMEPNSGCDFACGVERMETDDFSFTRSAKRLNTWTQYNDIVSLEWQPVYVMMVPNIPMIPMLTPWSMGKDHMDMQSGMAQTIMIEYPHIQTDTPTTEFQSPEDREEYDPPEQAFAMLPPWSMGKGHMDEQVYFDPTVQDPCARHEEVHQIAIPGDSDDQSPQGSYGEVDDKPSLGESIDCPIFAAEDRASQKAQLKKKSYGKGSQRKRSSDKTKSWFPSFAASRLYAFPADFVSKLSEMLESEDKQQQEEAIASMTDLVVDLSFDPEGCRVVQLAIHNAPVEVVKWIAAELEHCIVSGSCHPSANYVIQELIKFLPSSYVSFIAQKLLGHACRVARHRYGCRIVCRLLEHGDSEACRSVCRLLEHELLADVAELIRGEYAHHVIDKLLERGSHEQQQVIADSLCGDLHKNVDNQHAAFVMRNALKNCGQAEQAMIVESVMSLDPDMLTRIKRSKTRVWFHITETSSKLQALSPPVVQALSDHDAGRSNTCKQGRRSRRRAH